MQHLPSSYWRTVLDIEDSQMSEKEAQAEEAVSNTSSIKYHIKLGCQGRYLKPTVCVKGISACGNKYSSDDLRSVHDRHLHASVTQAQATSAIEPATDEQIALALAHLRNYQIKDDQQAMNNGQIIIYSRLSDSGFQVFQIRQSPHLLHSTFSRTTLSAIYGGCTVDTFPMVNPAKAAQHGHHRFMCLNALYNAFCPQLPGAPGLFFALRDPVRWPRQQELVFVRYGPNRWNFMGIYEITRSWPLSAEEFRSLDKKTQEKWITGIFEKQWGLLTLSAIYLHKLYNKKPNAEAIKKFSKRKKLLHSKVSRDDVRQAFFSGVERINCWAMRCIGYDADFKYPLIAAETRTVLC